MTPATSGFCFGFFFGAWFGALMVAVLTYDNHDHRD